MNQHADGARHRIAADMPPNGARVVFGKMVKCGEGVAVAGQPANAQLECTALVDCDSVEPTGGSRSERVMRGERSEAVMGKGKTD